MSEHKELVEKTAAPEKPKKLWDGALKMVRGETTSQLIENFTAEMTLVAEGLCEDQGNLRRDLERAATEEDRRIQALQARIDAAETSLEQERAAHDRDLTELRTRLASLEKKANARPAREKEKNQKHIIIRNVTLMVCVAAAAWVIVTLLNKLL